MQLILNIDINMITMQQEIHIDKMHKNIGFQLLKMGICTILLHNTNAFNALMA